MSRDRDIAIVGMAGRFPGARDLDEFWANIRDGVESVSFFTDEQLLAAGASPDHLDQPNFVRAGACLPGVDTFDAEFFGYTAREAEIMDPQHRVFLETAWQALEHSGYDPARFDGDIGVFAGAGSNGYLAHVYSHSEIVETTGGTQILLGNELGFLSTRVSYKLDLRGPSVSLRTACSTSLVAVHLACRSLRERECDMALSGGVFLNLEQERGYFHQEGSFVSPDGHCRPFDARAAGTLFGSGAGAVVLKRLDDALADGDTVYAVVKGSAVNNDGAVKVGFTAPTVAGQARVIADALRDAGTDPADIGYVEAHGTGTSLGDPIEVRALTKAYDGVPSATVALGSLKSNFGHLDAASGIAGLIKTVLSLWHETLPRTLHFESPNPDIDFAAGPFTVQRDTAPWPRSGGPRLAGVSAFGFGGTNAHVVLQEGPPQGRPDAGGDTRPERPSHLLVLSARNHAALEELSDAMAARLRRGGARLADVTYTAATGRHRFPVRRSVTGPDAASLAAALEARDPARVTTGECGGTPPRVAFLISGQGAQYPGMARELYAHEPVFREAVDHCLTELASRDGADAGLVELLLDADGSEAASTELDRTGLAQPALFVLEYALARLWASWGVEPAALLGHSLGELVAACLAGVFTPRDALALVALRGQLMQEQPTGAMLSVVADRATVESLLPADVFLAAHNGPKDCVVSGDHTAVAAFAALLAERGTASRPVSASHAFHSAMMRPMVDRFVAAVAAVPRQAPRTRFVSNVTGTWITDDEARDPAYWGRHVLAPVEFDAGVRTLSEEPGLVFLEIGPGQTLTSLARRVVTGGAPRLVTSTLPHRQDRRHPVEAAQRALGQLWLAGGEPDWTSFHQPRDGGRRRRVALPVYPFQRQRYWLDRHAAPAASTPATRRSDVTDWIQAPSWERSVLPPASTSPGGRRWLVFDDRQGLAEALTARLRRDGAQVTTVIAGDRWTQAPDRFTIDPADAEHYTRLLRALREQDQLPTRVAHCWNVTGAAPDPENGDAAAGFAAARRAFDGLLFLAQALNSHPDQPDCDIWVVSDGLHRVLGTERLMPLKSTLLGPVRVIPREHPGLACRSVDIVLDGEPAERTVDQLLREFSLPPGHAAVAYRGAHRWSQTYVPAPLPPSDGAPSALRDDGVYLITGGTGGLGLALAEHLARPGRRLALLARTAVPPEEEWDRRLAQPGGGRTAEVIEKVRAVRRRGAEVMLLTADVCDHAQVEAAVSAVVDRWGGVHGAFHAAGLAGGGLVQLATSKKAAQVMGPKVLGTLHLDHALAGLRPDFLFLFGSNAAHVGDFGLADYVAANSFLDAYAHTHAVERRVLTVDWGPWKEAGMAVAADLPDALAEVRGKDVAERGMASAQALEALERVLSSSPEPQLIVSPVGVKALIEQAFALGADGGGDERLAGLGAPQALHPRPDVPSTYVPPNSETQRRLCKAWQDLLGIDQVGVDDSFFDLGGSSLVAIQLVATVNKSLGASLTVAQLYEVLTVAGLARLIDGADAEPAETSGHAIEQVKSRAGARRQHQQNRMARARARRQT